MVSAGGSALGRQSVGLGDLSSREPAASLSSAGEDASTWGCGGLRLSAQHGTTPTGFSHLHLTWTCFFSSFLKALSAR